MPLSWLSTARAADLAAAVARCRAEPYAAKRWLARDVAAQFHGPEAATAAEAHFDRLFKAKQAPAEVPAFDYTPGTSLAQIIKEIGFAPSSSEARRLAAQGGVQLDDVKVTDANVVPAPGEHRLKYGKLKFARLVPKTGR